MARSTTTLVIYRTRPTTLHATADEATSIYQTTSPHPYNFSAPLKKILCNKIPCHHIDLMLTKSQRPKRTNIWSLSQYLCILGCLSHFVQCTPQESCLLADNDKSQLCPIVKLWCPLNHSVPQQQKKTFDFCTYFFSCSAAETE